MALALRFGTHDFYLGQEVTAIEFYATSAQQAVGRLASQGIPELEVVQSLCLLVLVDVSGELHFAQSLLPGFCAGMETIACKPGQAWMSIGTLSRLEALRTLSRHGFAEASSDPDASLRCHWTVFLLEQTFTPQQRATAKDDEESDYPASASIPPSLPPGDDSECPPDLYSDDAAEDLGIAAYYIKMVGIWGHLSAYMHRIRLGKAETA